MPNKYNFKVAVFDLDYTLWNGIDLYPEVVRVLDDLRVNGICMHVASFHLKASKCCERLGIKDFFSSIQYGRNRTKSQMITEIMKLHPGIQKNDIVFFDDTFDNIINVKVALGIKTVHVTKGLSSKNIPCMFINPFNEGTMMLNHNNQNINNSTYCLA